jgi:flavin reductase
MRTVTSNTFVNAMRGAAAGVNIVTTDGVAGRFGLTVSAFSSVSAEPPSVLVCVNRQSPACEAIRRNRQFCVNVLSANQYELANTGDAYDFSQGSWQQLATSSPLLDEAVASFDCTLGTAIDAGTHTIFIGLVCAAAGGSANPLVYANQSYRRACCAAYP